MRRLTAVVLTSLLALACGQSQKDSVPPEKRVEQALAGTTARIVEQQLASIPEGTKGRDQVVAHLEALRKKQAENTAAREAAREKQNAEQRAAQQEAARRDAAEGKAAIARLSKEVDNVKNVTFLRHRNSTPYVNTRSDLQLYIVTAKGAVPTLRLVVTYVAEDWLFVQKYFIKTDTASYTIDPGSSFRIERDNSGGKIWEWYDAVVTDAQLPMLQELSKAKGATLRYEGRQYYKDRTVSASELGRLREVLLAYRALAGSPS
jgi:Skp family chaperone for outer membrane proteins